MPKIAYSIIIALGIHLLVLVSSDFFWGKSLSQTRNLIEVSFSSAGKSPSLFSGQAPLSSVTKRAQIKKGGHSEERTGAHSPGEKGESHESSLGDLVQGGPGDFGESVTSFSEPSYPKLAIQRSLEGEVRLRVNVSSEGYPEATSILESSGHEILDRAAVEATKNWRFQKKDYPYSVEKKIVFKLRG